jgi:hypothetical protein
MTDQPTPAPESPLRQRIAEALYLSHWPNGRWELRPLEEHDLYLEHADAVLAVRDRYCEQLEAGRATWKAKAEEIEADRDRLRERLRLLTDEKVAHVTGPTTDLLCEEINRLKAEVAAAREYAAEMRDFASPHGVSVHYADQLVQVMDRAKDGQ